MALGLRWYGVRGQVKLPDHDNPASWCGTNQDIHHGFARGR